MSSELTLTSELALWDLMGSELARGDTTSYPARSSLVRCLSLSPLSSYGWGRHVHYGVVASELALHQILGIKLAPQSLSWN